MKLKKLAIISGLFMLISTVNAFAGDISWYEDNINASTYNISTAEELVGLGELVNGDTAYGNIDFLGKSIVLQNDIDISSYTNWKPIGNYATENTVFSGSFNGNYHTISGLSISSIDNTFNGLFGVVSRGSVLNVSLKDTNINITQVSLERDEETPIIVGSIAGALIQGGISYCENLSGTITENCVDITANDVIGGVIGYINNGGSTYNGNAADIDVKHAGVGGAIGYIITGAANENYNKGKITSGENCQSGGIVLSCMAGSIMNSCNYGDISTTSAFKSGTVLNLNSGCTLGGCIDFGINDSKIYTSGTISKLVYNNYGSLQFEPGTGAKMEDIYSYNMYGDKIDLNTYLISKTNTNLVRVIDHKFPVFVWEVQCGNKIMCGDMNKDKALNNTDLTLILHCITGGKNQSEEEAKLSDFDGNNRLNILDAVRLINDKNYNG